MKCKNLVSVADLEREDIDELFALTAEMKESSKRGVTDLCLAGKTLGMIFEKSSMRTRVSFEVAMTQMGGHAIYLTKHDINLGERESIKDVYFKSLTKSLTIGKKILEEGGISLDAVEQVIRFFEDDSLFNAGKGAVFTSAGVNEMDA